MGTDIHLRVQFKNSKDHWEFVESKIPSKYDGTQEPEEWYDTRNYRVFAILANVRNGYGFAGIPYSRPLNFISEPKGLPKDLENEEFFDMLHSCSWLSLKELLEFNWEQTMQFFADGVTQTYAEVSHGFYSQFIPRLVNFAITQGIDIDNVRIVFGFDS